VIDDAIRYREPDREGCCEDGEACRDHANDQVIATAMSRMLSAVESSAGDEAVMTALCGSCQPVLAAIAAATGSGGARDDV
jgi:hypothetical protein